MVPERPWKFVIQKPLSGSEGGGGGALHNAPLQPGMWDDMQMKDWEVASSEH